MREILFRGKDVKHCKNCKNFMHINSTQHICDEFGGYAVMLSIKPKWCELIASGRKTIEVRKSRPKLEVPFKCYIYCTKAGQRLIAIIRDGDENYGEIYHGKPVFIKTEKGSVCDMYGKRQKVIGEFVCDYILEITPDTYGHHEYFISDDDLNASCLTTNDLWEYGSGETLYGWHISDLVIYDKPKEISEFAMTRPPQSWCYCEGEKE